MIIITNINVYLLIISALLLPNSFAIIKTLVGDPYENVLVLGKFNITNTSTIEFTPIKVLNQFGITSTNTISPDHLQMAYSVIDKEWNTTIIIIDANTGIHMSSTKIPYFGYDLVLDNNSYLYGVSYNTTTKKYVFAKYNNHYEEQFTFTTHPQISTYGYNHYKKILYVVSDYSGEILAINIKTKNIIRYSMNHHPILLITNNKSPEQLIYFISYNDKVGRLQLESIDFKNNVTNELSFLPHGGIVWAGSYSHNNKKIYLSMTFDEKNMLLVFDLNSKLWKSFDFPYYRPLGMWEN